MGDLTKKRPSATTVIAMLALFLAVGGATAIALPGTNTVDSGDIKNKQVKTQDLRGNSVSSAKVKPDTLTGADINESSLSTVPSASNANNADNANQADQATNAGTVDGADANDLRTSSGFNANASVIALAPANTTVATTTISLETTQRIIATGVAELQGAEADERAQCTILIDGSGSLGYESSFDDIGTSNEATVTAMHAVTRTPGNYTALLRCSEISGQIVKDDAAISVIGVGT
jgi:hypothetical protein